ncbi:ac17 [Artaxa digramma nucleopolyhedrovirus]|uniref:Ac17 n=1 Tax=Artaxa digramma nucleopolyhedrovirus TaxID=3070910 RepID=A0AAE6R810_9ABAC|nr:ac17 [Euproctis digramma nucleopolyhedrovirus]QHB21797.1 ac17 [Artaxa digramma nucleopolyhedrovirus]
MLTMSQHSVSVYIDDALTSPTYVEADNENKKILMKFCVSNKEKGLARVRVNVQSDNKYIQTTFVSSPRHVCIVNAKDRKSDCTFDGFPSRDDECRTLSFVAARVNPLKDGAGRQSVRNIVAAMEKNVCIRLFINEAIVDNVKHKWYHRVWFNDLLPHNKSRYYNHKKNFYSSLRCR